MVRKTSFILTGLFVLMTLGIFGIYFIDASLVGFEILGGYVVFVFLFLIYMASMILIRIVSLEKKEKYRRLKVVLISLAVFLLINGVGMLIMGGGNMSGRILTVIGTSIGVGYWDLLFLKP